jgi:crotonobetainyl-CoA:carnitine CoA-transferase CaiB-like acyl-CoA transferase
VAAAVRSESFFRIGDRPAGAGFAPLSRFWRTADGWVRTHANYPWHRAALLRELGVPEDADAVAAALAERRARDVEEGVFAAGGVAAAVRSSDEWREHPQGRALAAEPLIARRVVGDAPPRTRIESDLPVRGVRVLDLTRVIAGPVCTRFLAALGADVLRIDRPQRPDMPPGTADTLLGKRSAFADLGTRDGLDVLHGLLDTADLLVHGYRPGSLDRFGLGFEHLAERHPGLVVVFLDAWGRGGPWSGRRGFDSIVQAAAGIAVGESPDGARPGVLPCQLLDHGTGYLAAAAALDGLRRQAAAR